MPVGAFTPHVTATLMELSTLLGNNDLIEAYLKGNVDPADFIDKFTSIHGVPGSNHRVYSALGYNGQSRLSRDSAAAPVVSDLDNTAVLDYLIYRTIDDFLVGGRPSPPAADGPYIMFPHERVNDMVWERLGINPKPAAGAGLTTAINSWRHWENDAPDPSTGGTPAVGFADEIANRFEPEEYWDRWLTVPYASKRIWIPEPCVLFVVAEAVGTFNYTMSGEIETGINDWDDATYSNDQSTAFKLFIDEDNRKDRRNFTLPIPEFSAVSYFSNWQPISSSLSFTCYPRAQATVFGRVVVPVAGYYNISLKFQTPHWHGFQDDIGGANTWRNYDYVGDQGEITVARWESANIGAVAQFKRTALSTTDQGGDF